MSTIRGTWRADFLGGTARSDKIYGGAGNDMIFGLGGADRIEGGAGSDYLEGGAGNDVFVLREGAGRDKLVKGGSGHDRLEVTPDRAYGGGTFEIGGRFDSVESFELTGQGGKIYLKTKGFLALDDFDAFTSDGARYAGLRGSGADDVIRGFDLGGRKAWDKIWAGAGDDKISAFAGNDTVHGGSGDDTIDGGAGKDRLYGGTGADLVRGGSGDDLIFVTTRELRTGADTIDGGSGEDTLRLKASGWSELKSLRAEAADYLGGDTGARFEFDNGLTVTGIEHIDVYL